MKRTLCVLGLTTGLLCYPALAIAPVINADAGAAPVGFATATLNGELTAGEPAVIYINWGQDTNAWANTNSPGSLSNGVFKLAVTGLTAGTNYYYRCYATNGEGTGYSVVAVFTTQVEACFAGGSYDGYDEGYRQTVGYHMGTMFSIH